MRPGIIRLNLQGLIKKVIGLLILIGTHIQFAGAHQDHGVFRIQFGSLLKQFIGSVEVTQGPHGLCLDFRRIDCTDDGQITGLGFGCLAGPVQVFTVQQGFIIQRTQQVIAGLNPFSKQACTTDQQQ